MDVRDEIRDACLRLHIPEADFALVPDHEARTLFHQFLQRFTGGVDARWWWEHFTTSSRAVHVVDGKAFTRLTQIVPDPTQHVWFVAEDPDLPYYPIFDATPLAIEQVIGECDGFEYYLIAKDLTWLLCENHHGSFFAIGGAIQDRLRHLMM